VEGREAGSIYVTRHIAVLMAFRRPVGTLMYRRRKWTT
jgi:hypothetical protein